jgi:hypothetical protein
VRRAYASRFLPALALAVSLTAGPATAGRVTTAAVWHPPAGFFDVFHQHCAGHRGQAFVDCFDAEMARAGASEAALAFARRLDGEAYLEALDQWFGGPVAVAHVINPFRANENAAWLLVNGTPSLIDVDDHKLLALGELHATPQYRALARHYAEVTFWPGERGLRRPEFLPLPNGGQRFVIGYQLHDRCHACAIVGQVRYAFDFAPDGSFLGTRLLSVVPANR